MFRSFAFVVMIFSAVLCFGCSDGYQKDGISIKPVSHAKVKSNVIAGAHPGAVMVKDDGWAFAVGEQDGGAFSGNPPVFAWANGRPVLIGGWGLKLNRGDWKGKTLLRYHKGEGGFEVIDVLAQPDEVMRRIMDEGVESLSLYWLLRALNDGRVVISPTAVELLGKLGRGEIWISTGRWWSNLQGVSPYYELDLMHSALMLSGFTQSDDYLEFYKQDKHKDFTRRGVEADMNYTEVDSGLSDARMFRSQAHSATEQWTEAQVRAFLDVYAKMRAIDPKRETRAQYLMEQNYGRLEGYLRQETKQEVLPAGFEQALEVFLTDATSRDKPKYSMFMTIRRAVSDHINASRGETAMRLSKVVMKKAFEIKNEGSRNDICKGLASSMMGGWMRSKHEPEGYLERYPEHFRDEVLAFLEQYHSDYR